MNQQTELMTIDRQGAVAVQEPTPGELIKAAALRGDVAMVKELTGIWERDGERQAKRLFNAAFRNLQSETKTVQAQRQVMPDGRGGCRYAFASFEDIMAQIQPALSRNEFSIGWSSKNDGRMITQVMTLRHDGGHSEQFEFSVRTGKGPSGCTEAQADGAAATSAQRYCLCDALNISIVKGSALHDGAAVGGKLTSEQVESLKAAVAVTNSDPVKFLALAGKSAAFEEIPAVMFDMLHAMLAKKGRAQ